MEAPLTRFRVHADERGSLIALEAEEDLPFCIRRVYYIFGVPDGVERGFHAHRQLQQLMICTSGSCTVTLDDGEKRREFRLDTPSQGVFVDRMIWREMSDFSSDAVLVVLASGHYDRDDYIFSYEEFLAECRDLGRGAE